MAGRIRLADVYGTTENLCYLEVKKHQDVQPFNLLPRAANGAYSMFPYLETAFGMPNFLVDESC